MNNNSTSNSRTKYFPLKKVLKIITSATITLPLFFSTSHNISNASAAVNSSDFMRLSWLDQSILLQNDFFHYANGTWKKENPIPDTYPNWNMFTALQKQTNERIHTLLQEASETTLSSQVLLKKIGDFYKTGMDLATIEKQGLKPLAPQLEQINQIHDAKSLQNVITNLQTLGLNAFFSFGSMQDFKNSDQVIAALGPGILGLPDRDYYLKNDQHTQLIRQKYLEHIENLLILSGETQSNSHHQAQDILKLETNLAKAMLSRVEARQPEANYHIFSIKKLEKLSPTFSWHQFFAYNQLNLTQLNITEPNYIKSLDSQLSNTNPEAFRPYLKFILLNELASFLTDSFVKEDFKMAQLLTGTQKILPRWEQVVRAENGMLGHAIGRFYVERYFNKQDKIKVGQMIQGIANALRENIQKLTWMTETTKKSALHKLDKMTARIAYPTKDRDFSALEIKDDVYVLNILRTSQFLTKRDMNKIGKPSDKSEWNMTPQTINASYDPSSNTITIPAGILQPPFYYSNAPDAINYGAIGFVIGHEITHGFDDVGSQFDAKGNWHNWWTSVDRKQFNQAQQCVITQFSNYEVEPGIHVKGPLVVGEATADLGGLTLAYKAFHASPEYTTAQSINGPNHEKFTPDQQFFLSAAHIWASNIRPEYQRVLVLTDPHPPVKFRVNGTFANMPEFWNAFQLQKSSVEKKSPEKSLPMMHESPCKVW